ncbi:hypothetical protein M2651_00475 [Clostridium sp. SYSU_GA19001]|uniref:hypothetical protein n=1 Tax=Clostridium caldaquaticum TaxID=2940653 RepID=UPI00207728C0|nr:hypothetical protein [Clostridium caldaquaticum]MCM8709496.1 hypothetical protein [Clostridium caldaquaticum]
MDYIIKCTREEKEILQIALYGYLNRYRERLKEVQDSVYREAIEDKIRITEKMLEEIG